jgi:hypothetical protein
LSYIESFHNLERSLFSTIFLPPYRIGLLSEQEAWAFITDPGQSVLGRSPWDEWLAEHIFNWGGRHPYCIQHICLELFGRIWNQKEQLKPANVGDIADELGSTLRPFFDRLYASLENDGLIRPLVQAVESGYIASQFTKITMLSDLGYFLPEHAKEKKYVLFSPLFRDYLVQRGELSPPSSPQSKDAEPQPASPRVQKILNLEKPSRNVRLWFDDYRKQHPRIAEKPDVDGYTLLFLTGLEEGLTNEELLELRQHLLLYYRDDCEESGDKRRLAVLRTYLYGECRRWRQRFEEDWKGN